MLPDTRLAPPAFDTVVWLGMLCLGLAVPFISVCLLSRKPWQLSMAVIGWLGVSGWVAHQRLLLSLQQIPPVIAWLVAPPLLFVLLTAINPNSSVWRDDFSLRTIVSIQSFRFALELVMWRAALLGIMPVELSMQGYNLDVMTGLSALLLALAWPYLQPAWARQVARLWNLWGILCLLVIAILAVLISPQVHFLGLEAAHINSWVLFFPYVWLPALLVPSAVLGHVLTWRALRQSAALK